MPKSKTLSQAEIRRQYLKDRKANPDAPLFRARVDAPRTRADCEASPRPCPYVACHFHLFAHVCRQGTLKMPYGSDVEVIHTMADTCTLDVTDAGPQSQYRVSRLLNLTQQAVAKLERSALAKVQRYLQEREDDTDTDTHG